MPETYDLIIRGATVYDGSGAPGMQADVGVRGDRIARLGAVDGRAAEEIDAAGLALAPGFIDVHAHDDLHVLLTPDMDYKVMQGVTTTIAGNCGSGVVPYAAMRDRWGVRYELDGIPEWQGYGGYLETIDRHPPSLNVATLVGHGTLRFGAMGLERRPPTAAELDRMRAWLAEGLEAGAVGYSTGLVYEPGRYAATDELIALARECGRIGGLYASHMRDQAAGLLDSIRETIRIGEAGRCPVQVSHHKASGRENWGRVHDSLRLIEQARARGIDVTADQYPYTANSTALFALLQNGALRDDATGSGFGRVRAEDIHIAAARGRPDFEGRCLADLADEWDLPAEQAAQRVLDEAGGGVSVVCFIMDEQDIRTVLVHPSTMIGTDGVDSGSRPHPRAFGTYPRVLGAYARDQGLLSWEAAIHKMTGMPAEKFGVAGRGFIREGQYADFVLFDPATVQDRATYEQPRAFPAGIPYVFVNGVAVVREGEHTHARPGRALRRGQE
jgi:N-acyl-D-amino-acid deacylase